VSQFRKLGKRQTKWGKGKIAALRSALDETQEKFAARLGVTWSTVSRWERGHTVPSPVFEDVFEGLVRALLLAGKVLPSVATKRRVGRPRGGSASAAVDVGKHEKEVEDLMRVWRTEEEEG